MAFKPGTKVFIIRHMPVYEYECQGCGRVFSRFFWKIEDAEGTKCRCGSQELEQLVSKVAMHRSEESRLENLADPAQWGDLDENDPKSMARMIRKLGNEVGEDMGPEFDEMVDRLEAGEDPESVEESMGDALGGDDFSGGAADYDNLF
jgi:putative FmdB family regulatory protein